MSSTSQKYDLYIHRKENSDTEDVSFLYQKDSGLKIHTETWIQYLLKQPRGTIYGNTVPRYVLNISNFSSYHYGGSTDTTRIDDLPDPIKHDVSIIATYFNDFCKQHCKTQWNVTTSNIIIVANYYPDEKSSIGLHSDDEPSVALNSPIICFSFGASRELKLVHKTLKCDIGRKCIVFPTSGTSIKKPIQRKNTRQQLRVLLEDGSLFAMINAQDDFLHGIDKLSTSCGDRLSITIRIVNDSSSIRHSSISRVTDLSPSFKPSFNSSSIILKKKYISSKNFNKIYEKK